MSVTINRIGQAQCDLGRFEEAVRSFTQAVSLMAEVGDQHAEGVMLDRLGVACRELGRFDEAVRHHERAVVLLAEQDDAPRQEQALGHLRAAQDAARRSR